MATVHIQKRKRKNRNSYVLYYKDPATSKLKYFKTFQRQKDAQLAANDLRSLIDTGKVSEIRKDKLKLNFMTFTDISIQLELEWKRRLETDELKQKTVFEYLYMLNSLKRIFGKRLLCEISGKEILSYRSKVASEFSNVTSNRYLFVIKQLFKQGIEEKAIFDDPADPINYLSEKEQERSNFLLPSELDRLVDASQKTRSKFYLPSLIYLGAEHGASRQESLSLKWSNIDFEYEGQGLIKFFRTKNSRERIEYLMPRTKAALLEWQNHQQIMWQKRRIEFPREGFVFSRIDGGHIKRFDKAWKAACKIAGFENFHFHDLRHTFCSNLLLSGAGLKDVKEMIGHSDLSMTDRYSHLTLNHKRLQQSKLVKHYARSG